MTKIKKVVITAFGDESTLAIVEDTIADPGDGEVQITVEYTIVIKVNPQELQFCADGRA
jgi:NADPH:quinone reductase-like Zn-dependent oxidoreductase